MRDNDMAKNILLERMCDTCRHEFVTVCKLLEKRPGEFTCHLWEGFEMPKVVRLGYPNSMRESIQPIEIEIKINMRFDCMED